MEVRLLGKMYGSNKNLFSSFLGLVFEPGSTTTELENYEPTRLNLLILTLFAFSTLLPAIYTLSSSTELSGSSSGSFGVLLSMLLMVIIFFTLESFLLALLGLKASLSQLFALFIYPLAPIILGLWLIYLFDYLNNGTLATFEFLFFSSANYNARFFELLPIAIIIIQLNVLLVFFYALRSLGKMSFFSALSVTALSLIPFYLSFLTASFLANLIVPGTIENLLRLSQLWSGLL